MNLSLYYQNIIIRGDCMSLADFMTETSVSNEKEVCPGCGCTCPCDCTDCKECSKCKDH